MPWSAAAGAGISVLGGLFGKKKNKQADASQQAAAEANKIQAQIAKDQYEDYKTTYRPLEHSLVSDAQNFDTPENYEKAAGDAQSTVSTQLGLTKQRLSRTPGLDPSSAAAQAANVELEAKGAALGATAQNAARTGVQDKAWARKVDAVGLGKGLVTNANSGLASAAAGANQIAAQQLKQSNDTSSGIGSLLSGVVGGLKNANLFG